MRKRTLAGERFKHRCTGLLDLEHEPRATFGNQQRHRAARADTADAHYLERQIDKTIARQQITAIVGQAHRIAFKRYAKRG